MILYVLLIYEFFYGPRWKKGLFNRFSWAIHRKRLLTIFQPHCNLCRFVNKFIHSFIHSDRQTDRPTVRGRILENAELDQQ